METVKKAALQAVNHARELRRGGRKWRTPNPAAIKELRASLQMTQAQFAQTFGFDLDTLKSWESGRRIPDPQNTLMFAMIEVDPQFVKAAIDRVTIHDEDTVDA